MSGFRSRSRSASNRQAGGAQPGRKPTRSQPRDAHNNQARSGRRPGSANGPDPARKVAFDVVEAVMSRGAFANLVLPKALADTRLPARDKAFATELTYGCLRTVGVLDEIIGQVSSRPLPQIDHQLVTLLRLGAYQLLYMRVDNYAAVDTTVSMVDRILGHRLVGFANAVLRGVSKKNLDGWMSIITAGLAPYAACAMRCAHPAWIAQRFREALGDEHADELEKALEADSMRPVVHLVARPGLITADELAAATGGDVGQYSPYAVYLSEGGNPANCEAVRERLAAVQDEGSQLIARAVTVAPIIGADGGRWLDLCAGPGGKTALMGAIAATVGAHVDAVEIAPHRADLVRTTTEGLPVTVTVVDGRASGLEPGYDRVLVDAPCSGLGALRRRPEARWTKKPTDAHDLAELQYELVRAAVSLTRKGGTVIYSTCSPDLRETRAVVDRALSTLNVTEGDAHPLMCGAGSASHDKSVQLWPHREGTDAMFCAVLQVGS